MRAGARTDLAKRSQAGTRKHSPCAGFKNDIRLTSASLSTRTVFANPEPVKRRVGSYIAQLRRVNAWRRRIHLFSTMRTVSNRQFRTQPALHPDGKNMATCAPYQTRGGLHLEALLVPPCYPSLRPLPASRPLPAPCYCPTFLNNCTKEAPSASLSLSGICASHAWSWLPVEARPETLEVSAHISDSFIDKSGISVRQYAITGSGNNRLGMQNSIRNSSAVLILIQHGHRSHG